MNNNERGSTLIVTLLIIVVILIFSSVLINTTLNSAAQINKTEQDIQATHLAEMGVKYFHEALSEEIKKARKDGVPLSLQDVEQAIGKIVLIQVIVENSTSFELEVEHPRYNEDKNMILIPYKSKGIVHTPERIERVLSDNKTVKGAIVIPGNEEEDEGSKEPASGKPFTTRDEFDQLKSLNVQDIIPPENNCNQNEAISDSKVFSSTMCYKDLTLNPNSNIKFNQDLYINQDLLLKEPSTLTVLRNIQSNGKVIVEDHSKMNISGTFSSKNDLDINNDTNIAIKGAAEVTNRLDVGEGSTLSIGEFLFVHGDTDLYSFSKTIIGTDAMFSNKLTLLRNANLTIGNNIFIEGESLLESNSTMNIGGSLRLGNQLDIIGAVLHVKYHLFSKSHVNVTEKGTLLVEGNAYFEQPVYVDNTSKVCIVGSVDFKHNQSSPPITTASSCNAQPPGTIYVLNKPTDTGNNNYTDEVIIGSEGVQY